MQMKREAKPSGQRKLALVRITNCKLICSRRKNSGPPTLDWFKIQPTLLHAQGDLLFIFDCCFASLASKGRDEGRMELLAAAGAGARTPSPGELSFTSHFVTELRRGLQTRGGLRVAELHQLISQHAEQTPVCHNLRSDPKSSILLRRLGGKQRSSDEAKMRQDALGAFTFTVSIVEPPNERIVREFGDWLKTSAPKWISAVKVDEVIDLSNGLKDFVLENNVAGVKGRFLNGLERQDQALVMSEIHGINKIIANSRMASMYRPPTHTASGSMSLVETDNLAMSTFRAVEGQVNKFSRTIWSLLSNHRGYQKQSDLESLTSNSMAQRAGLVPAAKLSLVALEMTPLEAPEIIQGISVSFNTLDTADEYALARYNSIHIIIETQANSSSSSTQSIDGKGPPPRVSRICSLLSQPIPEQFRILHCIGYVTSGHHPGGIAYEMPLGMERYSSLREQFRKTSRVPLEVRYRLAHSIAITLQGLHAVRWVHKGIRAKNIFFFRNKGKLAYSFDEPWLLGYSHARENAVVSSMQADFRLESLIYLPKSRWGAPSEVFAYHHDIYAFVSLRISPQHTLLLLITNSIGRSSFGDWAVVPSVRPGEKGVQKRREIRASQCNINNIGRTKPTTHNGHEVYRYCCGLLEKLR